MKNYIYRIQNLKNPTFKQIRRIALNSISHLLNERKNKIREDIDRGKALLKTHEEMCVYLLFYGEGHEGKISDAVKRLPNELFNNEFEIVDWGCGQGLATVCLFDYLKSQGLPNNVQNITLIDPSDIALDRASLHVNCCPPTS